LHRRSLNELPMMPLGQKKKLRRKENLEVTSNE
jgi:hypothetical protein